MAEILRVNASTIGREIRRNKRPRAAAINTLILHAEKTVCKRKSLILFFSLLNKLFNSLFIIAYLNMELDNIISN